MRGFFVCVFVFGLVSCNNRSAPKERGGDIKPERIYHDYHIVADEERKTVSIVLQYRQQEDGAALSLSEAFVVSLDGEQLQADSARLSGTYYETERPLEDFRGNHIITFNNGRETFKTDFSFQPATLAVEIPEQVSKRPFSIRLNGLSNDETRARLVMVDTSFASPDVNEDIIIRNGEIEVGNDKLANLALGPINMELQFEVEKPLRKISKEGGRLLISHRLRRQFELTR